VPLFFLVNGVITSVDICCVRS